MYFIKSINYKVLGRHLLFWIAYISYQALQEGWMDKDELSFHLEQRFLTDIPVVILLAYINLYGLMPAFYYSRNYVKYVLALLLLLIAGGLAERYFTYLIWVPWEKTHDLQLYIIENKDFFIPVRILKNAVQSYPAIAITMLIKLMRNANEHEQRMRKIEKEKFKAEMRLLKAQINPHFFFNTLNSLYALTLKGSLMASKVVLRLSDLMHYMLYEADADFVMVTAEIKHLENYISIEEMRFADRLELSFQYSGDLEGQRIAPLLLLPFIENAFKHGIEDDSGWITINLKIVNKQLFLKVENSYKTPVKANSSGLGLINVKRRLELTYPSNYELVVRQNPETYEVDLKLQL